MYYFFISFLHLFTEHIFTSRGTREFRKTRFGTRWSLDSNVRQTLNQGSKPHRSECLIWFSP